MNLSDAIQIVSEYQLWRLDKPPYDTGQDGQPDMPYTCVQLTAALDALIAHALASPVHP